MIKEIKIVIEIKGIYGKLYQVKIQYLYWNDYHYVKNQEEIDIISKEANLYQRWIAEDRSKEQIEKDWNEISSLIDDNQTKAYNRGREDEQEPQSESLYYREN